MKEQYIAVGDIHGCPNQLNEILEATSQYRGHRYVFLGDYIDRGPDSEAVISTLRKIDAVFILGNHDLAVVEQLKTSRRDTFGDSFLGTKLSRASVEWLRDVPVPIYETDKYIFVHAGLNTLLTLKDQRLQDLLWSREKGDYLKMTSKTVVHGHTIVDAPEVIGNRININTGCGAKGPLTALVLPEMVFHASSISPGLELDWNQVRLELQEELKQFDVTATLEELEEAEGAQ